MAMAQVLMPAASRRGSTGTSAWAYSMESKSPS
jgi:hypothetical protein